MPCACCRRPRKASARVQIWWPSFHPHESAEFHAGDILDVCTQHTQMIVRRKIGSLLPKAKE